MILLIDNYDSFTYNLAQYIGDLGAEIRVVRNDAMTLNQIKQLSPSHIIISPGPGTPDDAGISMQLIQNFAPEIPILGVCLGHQAIGQAFGGKVGRAPRLMHGKVSPIMHDGRGVFNGLPSPFIAARYHSLVVEEPLPDCLEITARTVEGEMMGLRHKQYPVFGVQFHPESILTEHGRQLLNNFLEIDRVLAIEERQSFTTSSEMSMKGTIAKVMARQNLSEEEAEAAMALIMEGQATPAQISAFLVSLRMKGETINEITGCARAMRKISIQVIPKNNQDLVDTCGTGGDQAGTFNISTTAAFVVAGAGQRVAKHGNRSVSSKSGSADVLEALGINLDLTPEQIAQCIDEVRIGFLFAPKLHPAMKNAGGPRREIAARTIFNILGPLTNPAGAQAQVLGVYAPDLVETLARVLALLGSRAAFVVHGAGGLDELTTIGPNRVSELKNGQVMTYKLDPAELGFPRSRLKDLSGGDAHDNAVILRGILSGIDKGPRRDVVVLNAAAALTAGGKTENIQAGISLAERSLDNGEALNALDNLTNISKSFIKISG